MGSPFVSVGGVGAANVAKRAARHVQLPAFLTRVAGSSFHPPGVLSAGSPRMTCLLPFRARKAWGGRVVFSSLGVHAAYFWPAEPLNTTQQI